MRQRAWLVRTSGALAGSRYPLQGNVTRIGRGPQNDILIEDDAVVSARHCEIRRVGERFEIQDLDSTNGTYVNGTRITRAALDGACSIQLGPKGPQLAFLIGSDGAGHNETIRTDAPAVLRDGEHEDVVAEAMARVHRPKWHPKREDTLTIMRRAVRSAVARSRRNLRIVIAVLAAALIGLGGFTAQRIVKMRQDKQQLDAQIREVEELLAKAAEDPKRADEMVEKLDRFQGAARQLTGSLLYRLSVQEKRDPVEEELKSLFADFGAETYNIPPDLLAHVERSVQILQGPDRQRIRDAFGRARGDLDVMREMFRQENLPPDLAYMTVVESAVTNAAVSPAGAVGPWQLMAPTARAMGLRVDGQVDERLDVRKSTVAARKLIRELILDFGAGGSVMLAVAAFNSGTSRVKQAVRTVKDPIKQRNFWYLYRTRALPQETREYVPKVLAVLIVARAPAKFGFGGS